MSWLYFSSLNDAVELGFTVRVPVTATVTATAKVRVTVTVPVPVAVTVAVTVTKRVGFELGLNTFCCD